VVATTQWRPGRTTPDRVSPSTFVGFCRVVNCNSGGRPRIVDGFPICVRVDAGRFLLFRCVWHRIVTVLRHWVIANIRFLLFLGCV